MILATPSRSKGRVGSYSGTPTELLWTAFKSGAPAPSFGALQGHGDEVPAPPPKPLNICQDSNRNCNDIKAEARLRGDTKIG